MRKIFFLLIFISGILLTGCYDKITSIKTFVDPAIQTTSIKKIAAFSMRNTAFSPGETMEMDRIITQGLLSKNSFVSIIGITESTEMLNKENLTKEFTDFLVGFEHSGIPNTVFLNNLKSKFDIDAIFQGRMSEVVQHDKNESGKAQTGFTIRYTLLSTSNGNILWEGTCSAKIVYGKSKSKFSPPFSDVGALAKEKIILSLPTLNK
jgi:hypothetical protein